MAKFFLLDTAQHLHFYKKLDKAEISYASLYDGYPESNLKEIAPLLIELNDQLHAHIQLSDEIKNIGMRVPALSIIESKSNLYSLAENLRQFHVIDIPERQQMLLRWYDTRILPVWISLLSEDQKNNFTRTIDSWHYFDRYGQMQEVILPPESPNNLDPISYTLDAEQYQKLMQASEADTVLSQLRRIIPDEIRSTPYPLLFPFLEKQISESRAHRIKTIDDQVQYTLLALYTCEGFIDHPIVKQGFANNNFNIPQSFTDWALSLPDDVWNYGRPLWEEGKSQSTT